jgi:hypothetical protein
MEKNDQPIAWAKESPSAETLNAIARERALLWPGWPWEEVLRHGVEARRRRAEPGGAVLQAAARYRIPAGAVRKLWLEGGLIAMDGQA